jgi:hypothetical protein
MYVSPLKGQQSWDKDEEISAEAAKFGDPVLTISHWQASVFGGLIC